MTDETQPTSEDSVEETEDTEPAADESSAEETTEAAPAATSEEPVTQPINR